MKLPLPKRLVKKTITSTIRSQQGVGLAVVIAVVAVILLGAIVLGTPQIRNTLLPATQKLNNASPSATPHQYSEKQLLYIRNKETIKQGLNLSEEQFNLLVESADKN